MSDVTLTTDRLAASARLIDSQIDRAIAEVKRILDTSLTVEINRYNTARGLTQDTGVRYPKSIEFAPNGFDDTWINKIGISYAVQTSAIAPRRFRNDLMVMVYSIDAPQEAESGARNNARRAERIRTVLNCFLTNHCDVDDVRVWDILEPQGVTPLPDWAREYSGTTCSYRLSITPST